MNRFRSLVLAGAWAMLLPAAAAHLPAQTSPERAYEAARIAWEDGAYPEALTGFGQVLRGPGAERFLEPIALLTGELFHVREAAPDGRNPRFSPDGRFAAFDVPVEAGALTRIMAAEGVRPVAEIRGEGLVFSPAGGRVAYLAPDGRIVVRDLEAGTERRLEDGGLVKAELLFSADGEAVYVVGAPAGALDRTEIFAVHASASRPTRLTAGPGSKVAPMLAADGHLVFRVQARSPLAGRQGMSPGAGSAGEAADVQEGVSILHLPSGRIRHLDGAMAPALSADGQILVYTVRDETAGATEIRTSRVAGGETATIFRTEEPVGAPAISPDGGRVAFAMLTGVSWEVYLADAGTALAAGRAEGSRASPAAASDEPVRLTRDVQHDRFPLFVNDSLLLAFQGEGRHRRSYLYDVRTLERRRFHHNNTVRTIAPEYEWAVSPTGRHVLIVADRDGDTISPERGLFLADLGRRVTRDEVLARLESNLSAERALREKGEAIFTPIADQVRVVADRVSLERLWEYQQTLYGFGSKHITQPGNRPAAEYIHRTLASFGYQPAYQWFEPRDIRSANVVAVLPGTENPELVYVLSSHFDSVARSPGADDNSSGTAVLLETARILAEHRLPATVVFASLTAEESGLLGAREFVRVAQAEGTRIVGVLNNDMMGWTRDARLDNTIRYSNAGIRDLQHAAAFLFSDLITYDSHYYRGTDAAVFYQAYGDIVGGIGSYPVLGNPHYHQATDRLETINQQLVAEVARTTAASLMLLASSPSRLTGLEFRRTAAGVELRWEPSPERAVNRYEVVYGPAEDPGQRRVMVDEPRALLSDANPGDLVAVRAWNARGLHGWDWVRTTVR